MTSQNKLQIEKSCKPPYEKYARTFLYVRIFFVLTLKKVSGIIKCEHE